jgi:hypothetical protein
LYDPEPETILMELQGPRFLGLVIPCHIPHLVVVEVVAEDLVADPQVAAEAQVADAKCSHVTA